MDLLSLNIEFTFIFGSLTIAERIPIFGKKKSTKVKPNLNYIHKTTHLVELFVRNKHLNKSRKNIILVALRNLF